MPRAESGAIRFSLAFTLEGVASLGPGRIDLLDAIGNTGSISAAARSMGMSYRKAWRLVDDLNRSFCDPVVETAFGGARGGGARLTETGRRVSEIYRRMERTTLEANADAIADLKSYLADTPDRSDG